MWPSIAQTIAMPARPEKAASLVIKDRKGKEMYVSAVIHQDAHFLHANRISLIGTRDKEIELLGLDTDHVIEWEEHVRADWRLSDDPTYSHRISGTGWLNRSGMTHGVMIADDSIQPYADIELMEYRDELRSEGLRGPKLEYLFLQRPSDWHVSRLNWRSPDPPRLLGPWKPIKALGVRYRMVRVTEIRDDERIAQERERIDLPGIEIAPLGDCDDETAFFCSAERLWFLFRVLLVFRYRQFVHTLVETKIGTSVREMKWHSVRLEPRERNPDRNDAPFLAPLERYLSRGATALLSIESNRQLLHAAAYGYASSYKAGVMESALTACIEGMERLVEAFEQSRSLSRETIDQKRWKKLGRLARRAAVTVGDTVVERKAIERALSGVPTLRLIERIGRMVKAQRPKWRRLPEELLQGAERMIKMRNDIVHGRMVEDLSALRIETLRAQVLFERLWLGILDCGDLQGSGWPAYQIKLHYEFPEPKD